MSVLFVPHTERSELAKRIMERSQYLVKVGNQKFRIKERTRDRLVDLLLRCDDWYNRDYERVEGEVKGICLLCLHHEKKRNFVEVENLKLLKLQFSYFTC